MLDVRFLREAATPTDAPAAPPAPPASSAVEAPAPEAIAGKQAEAPVPAAAKDSAPAAPNFQALLEKAEKERIPALMSERDLAKNEANELREALGAERELRVSADGEWLTFLETAAKQNFTATQLLDYVKRQRSEKTAAGNISKAERTEALEIVTELYRKSDRDFAEYIASLADDGNKVTRKNLAKHRATFTAIRGSAPAPAAVTPTPAPAAAATKAPVTPGAGGPASDDGQPLWRPGISSRELFNRAGNAKRVARE